uniref:Uncharacterized protein n=1 Tax=Tanacetum cinerariifolium TaxID=118510 RepID=A0A699IA94_TANCI|nr:hypothetical protein [Tanacetum cinerariifolium]
MLAAGGGGSGVGDGAAVVNGSRVMMVTGAWPESSKKKEAPAVWQRRLMQCKQIWSKEQGENCFCVTQKPVTSLTLQ